MEKGPKTEKQHKEKHKPRTKMHFSTKKVLQVCFIGHALFKHEIWFIFIWVEILSNYRFFHWLTGFLFYVVIYSIIIHKEILFRIVIIIINLL